MVKQGFSLRSRDWYVMVYYGVWPKDLSEIRETLMAGGCPPVRADSACRNLSGWNTGYTFTNYDEHLSLLVMSRATSAAEMFDSIVHELKHLVEHISNYYGLDPKEELAAYLQEHPLQGCVVLVKGSRSTRMEKVIASL